MFHLEWELNERDKVELKVRPLRQKQLLLNGKVVEYFSRRAATPLELPNGRTLSLQTVADWPGGWQLRMDDETILPSQPGYELACEKCQAHLRGFERFCSSCGQARPSLERELAERSVSRAARGIAGLFWLFFISAIILAALQYREAQQALQSIAALDAQAQWTQPLNGKLVTVGELRAAIEQEPLNVLYVNLFLAALMGLLYLWGRRSPLLAIIVAAAVYVSVIVLSAMVIPASLFQGIIIKVIVMLFLFRGIKAGILLRRVSA